MDRRAGSLELIFLSVVVLGLVVAVSSCVISHPDYPPAWPPVERLSASSCPDVTGMFENQSVNYGTGTGVLGHLLIRNAERPKLGPGGRHIAIDARITQPSEGILELQTFAFRGDKVPEASASFSREKGDFDCDSGWVRFRSSVDGGASGPGVGVGGGWVALSRSNDGFLVAKVNMLGAGLALGIVPVAGSMAEWYRFKPAAPLQLPDKNAPVQYP